MTGDDDSSDPVGNTGTVTGGKTTLAFTGGSDTASSG